MRVLGVNAGNGVILYPFKRYIVGNIEPRSVFHTKGDKQWELNFDAPMLKKVKLDQLPEIRDIDVIISHPDCGHSSVLAYSRAKKMSDPKDNFSVTLFFKALDKYRPKVFLMENLPKFIENYGEEGLQSILSNYNLAFHNVSVSEFGNSQITRVRLVIVGVRKDLPKFLISFFRRVYKTNILKVSSELIKGLGWKEIPQLCHIREDLSDTITLYARYKDVINNIRIEWITSRANENRWKVVGGNFTTAPGVYKNRAFDYPVTVRPTNRQFNHLGLMMTPRELAKIQGIPDSFILYHDTNNKKYSINKGRITVTKSPPFEIGLWFFNQIKKVKKWI